MKRSVLVTVETPKEAKGILIEYEFKEGMEWKEVLEEMKLLAAKKCIGKAVTIMQINILPEIWALSGGDVSHDTNSDGKIEEVEIKKENMI